ncbi:hypothetical protein E0H75_34340 [Kribbella capetownensis]|uniref:Uncharacterized protein n=1 Tax=Kribbella capetownensis TaxID=1572659 RepID=A0A4R0JRH0_9ACTN|nr:hypothetical protein E0H75_34340 [Kribbella capetownensis]
MADQTGAESATDRSPLDQAAADDSITQARTRAVDPVPIVTEPGGATLESVLEKSAGSPAAGTEVGVNRRLDPEVQTVDGRTAPPAPLAGARRRLSPRPVPVSRRRRPPATAPAPATDEEPTPAEEMDDVGTHDDKAAAAEADKAVTASKDTDSPDSGRATATATKPARPKTAAEIVAEQRARERAAAEAPAAAAGTGAAGSEDAATGTGKDAAGKDPAETSVTTPVSKVPATSAGASGNKPPTGRTAVGTSGKGKQALGTVGSGVKRLRNLLASLIWLVAVLAAAVLALGALFTALDQTNQSNEIVRWVLERGQDLVGPFKDLFRLETAKNTLLVNWGIAALVYLIVGKIVERFVRP